MAVAAWEAVAGWEAWEAAWAVVAGWEGSAAEDGAVTGTWVAVARVICSAAHSRCSRCPTRNTRSTRCPTHHRRMCCPAKNCMSPCTCSQSVA